MGTGVAEGTVVGVRVRLGSGVDEGMTQRLLLHIPSDKQGIAHGGVELRHSGHHVQDDPSPLHVFNGVGVGVEVGMAVGVSVGMGVSVGVGIGVSVGVGVLVGSGVGVSVGIGVGVLVGRGVGVAVGVRVGVSVGNGVGVLVGVGVGVLDGVGVGVSVGAVSLELQTWNCLQVLSSPYAGLVHTRMR